MLSEQLPKQIELLVDSLRKQDQAQLSLIDVASVTEVLIATMQAFFRSIDTSIYRECRSLSEYISNARMEIASLQPVDLEDARIPRAGLELDAIVQHTESATNTIMTAAEEIMGLDSSDPEKFQEKVQENVLEIFEACSFQDITGQRISKVIETLSHIEERVSELRDLLGVTEEHIQEASKETASSNSDDDDDSKLLRGPALEGEGIDQSAVDALMGGEKAESSSAPAETKPEEAAPPPKKKTAKPEPAKVEAPKPVAPEVLDSMFEEDFDVNEEIAAQKKEAETPPATPKASSEDEAKKEEELSGKEEVSQDDIDALFN